MKRKLGKSGPPLVKTSISIPKVLYDFAETQCEESGFNSFSAFVAHLLREAKEERGNVKSNTGLYPSHRPSQHSLIEDGPKARDAKKPRAA